MPLSVSGGMAPDSSGQGVLKNGGESYLRHEVTRNPAGVLGLTYSWDDAGMQAMIDRHFGKTLLFTDQSPWTDQQIIAAYRSQAKLEDAFKQMNDPRFVRWRRREARR